MNTKTYTPRESEIDRRWYVVDAADQTLGRLASRVARVLEGKHKPTYAAHLDTGDHVIILNRRHLRRVLRAYLAYYHRSRTHLALAKDAPDRRPMRSGGGTIVVTPEVGGLHHRYDRQAA